MIDFVYFFESDLLILQIIENFVVEKRFCFDLLIFSNKPFAINVHRRLITLIGSPPVHRCDQQSLNISPTILINAGCLMFTSPLTSGVASVKLFPAAINHHTCIEKRKKLSINDNREIRIHWSASFSRSLSLIRIRASREYCIQSCFASIKSSSTQFSSKVR